jgi:hypothetical protein
LLKRKRDGLELPDELTLLDKVEKLDKIRSSCVLLLLEWKLPDRLDLREIPIPVFLRLSDHRAMLGSSRLRVGRSSFEESQDAVQECLKLGVSGTWESFCHGRFRHGVVGTDLLALTYSNAIVEYQSIKDNPHGYDEANPGRPPNG